MYGVVYKDSVYIPGDERSRTHPGHGYPASYEYFSRLETFETKEKLQAWIVKNRDKKFTAYKLEPLTVEVVESVIIK